MSKEYIKIPFEQAKDLLKEGDILLFRGSGIISNLIKIAGAGAYSHVAIASCVNDEWEVIEFREWLGGRSVNLYNYLIDSIKSKSYIDVYRSTDEYTSLFFNYIDKKLIRKKVKFDGKKVTQCMRNLTGLPYSYKRIFLILKIKLFKLNLLRNIEKITSNIPTDEIVYPVCSTVISHCFSRNKFGLLKNRSDEYMEPSDISRSPYLNYLFTLDI